MSAGRVLLFDSDPASAALIARGFAGFGVELETVDSVAQGAVAMEADRPDLVIVTDRCEGQSGLDVVRTLQRLAPDVPLVFAPTFAAPRTQRRALEVGAAAVVDQPCELSRLLSVSARWLASDSLDAHAS